MTYVICDPCRGVKDQSCVAVCPVDCIHPTAQEFGFAEARQLYIDPEVCIDCGACEPICPVQAIRHEDNLPELWRPYPQINADFFQYWHWTRMQQADSSP